MKPLNKPITDYATVQQILKISQKASKDIEPKFTYITFDLAVAKMACLVWHKQLLFSDVIFHLDVFHIISAYLKAVGKIMSCSGYLLPQKCVPLAQLMALSKENIITDPSEFTKLSLKH